MKRQARLFAIAEYLRGRRTGVTAEILAERFDVTVRTIYRDLDALREASLPLNADRGPGGGYALDKSYTLPPVNFTAREAALLCIIGRWATEMRLLPFTETLASAMDKVRAALSTTAQRELIRHMDDLKFIGVPVLAPKPDVRAAVERAWFEQCPLEVEYHSRDWVIAKRTVRLKSALFERTMTVLVAECTETGETLRLRLDKIDRARCIPNASTSAA
jgi:predicted DNA-binding transcriptional regulator YafY